MRRFPAAVTSGKLLCVIFRAIDDRWGFLAAGRAIDPATPAAWGREKCQTRSN